MTSTQPVLIVQVDGTPGLDRRGMAGLGIVLRRPQGQVLAWHCALAPAHTSNEAEYQAVIAGLRMALKRAPTAQIYCLSDSQVVIEQLGGSYAVRVPTLQVLHAEVLTLVKQAATVRFIYIPREFNRLADALAWEALGGRDGLMNLFASSQQPSTR